MDHDLAAKTALVTGSGRNIGRAIALEFAGRGANVIVNARSNAAEAQAVADEIRQLGVGSAAVVGDAANPATVQEFAAQAAAFGGIDIYVSNSSARPVRTFFETSPEEWEQIVGVQLDASFLLAEAFVPGMIEKGWGRIIHITGPSAYLGVKERPHAAGKGAIGALTKSLAIELGPHGITVNDVAPGEIDGYDPPPPGQPVVPVATVTASTGSTGSTGSAGSTVSDPPVDPRHRAGARLPVGRIGQPEEIAYACGFLASPRASFYTGTVMVCAGGEWFTN